MASQPASQFLHSIHASLAYWRERTRELDDAAIVQLDRERENLYRVAKFALGAPDAWRDTALVLSQMVTLVERRGYWHEWIPLLQKSMAGCQDSLLKCELLNQLGLLYYLDQQIPAAITIHQEALALAETTGDKVKLAIAHYRLSADYLRQRAYHEAERHGETALAAFTELPASQGWLAAAYNMVGEIARHQGKLAEAEARLRQAVALRRSLNRPLRLARCLNDLGNTLWAAQRFDEALSYFTEAAELLAPTIYELDKIMLLINIGTLYYYQEKWEAAETAFRQADSAYLRQSGHVYYQAAVATNLGSTLLKQGKADEAIAYLQTAIGCWQKIQDDQGLGNALGVLAKALASRGEIADAISLYDEAIRLLDAYPDDAWARQFQEKLTAERQALLDR